MTMPATVLNNVKSCQIVQIWGKWGAIAIIQQTRACLPISMAINGSLKVSDKFSFWCVMCHDWCQGFGQFLTDCRACDWVRRWAAVFQIQPKKWHRHHEYERRPMTQNNTWRSAQLVDIAVLAWFYGSWRIAYRLADLMPLRRCQWQSWASA